MERTYRLVLDLDLFLDWGAIAMADGTWWIASEDSSEKPRAVVDADLALIERSIRGEPALARAYYWRPQYQIPAFAFTDPEELVFRMKFCGEEIDT